MKIHYGDVNGPGSIWGAVEIAKREHKSMMRFKRGNQWLMQDHCRSQRDTMMHTIRLIARGLIATVDRSNRKRQCGGTPEITMNTPTNSEALPPTNYSASSEAVQYADYILNHYSRDSHADKLCLARDLERHGWRKPTLLSDTPETDAAINDSAFENKNHPHTDWVPAQFARRLERERNAALLPNVKDVAAAGEDAQPHQTACSPSPRSAC